MIGRLDKRRSEQPCTVTNAAVGTSNPPAAGSNPAGRAECLVGYRGSPRRVPAPVRIRALPVHLLLVDKGVPKRPQVVLIVVSCSSAVRSRARCLGKEVAGLNDAQIPSALKDFQALDAIPVSFEALDPSTHASNVQGEQSRSVAAAACADVRGETDYRNVRGELLAWFALYREFRCSGSSITYLGPVHAGGNATSRGASLGWRYEGVVDSNSAYFSTTRARAGAGTDRARRRLRGLPRGPELLQGAAQSRALRSPRRVQVPHTQGVAEG